MPRTATVSGIRAPCEKASATPKSEVSLPNPMREISRKGKNTAPTISTSEARDSAMIRVKAPARGLARTVLQRTQRAVSPGSSSRSTCNASQRGQAISPAPVDRSYSPSVCIGAEYRGAAGARCHGGGRFVGLGRFRTAPAGGYFIAHGDAGRRWD